MQLIAKNSPCIAAAVVFWIAISGPASDAPARERDFVFGEQMEQDVKMLVADVAQGDQLFVRLHVASLTVCSSLRA